MKLNDKKILVTGSSSGIGQSIAVACAKEGMFVVVHYRNNKEGAEETLAAVKEYSDGVLVQADLTVLDEVKAMFTLLSEKGIVLSCLVNNAGEARGGAVDNYEVWNDQLQNILLSQVMVTNEFVAQGVLTEPVSGKIVNISSQYAYEGKLESDYIQYSVAKSAVNAFTHAMARELAPEITVNAVAPGSTNTRVWSDVPEEEMSLYLDTTLRGRLMEPSEVVELVMLILKNDAIAGEVIRLDGGAHLV